MKGRLFFVSSTLTIAFIIIVAIFWYQESQYLLPTPIPADYRNVLPGEAVNIATLPGLQKGKPVLVHFFNPDCPCSRFNSSHFREIISRYKGNLQFYAVINTAGIDEAREQLKAKDGIAIPILMDTRYALAKACGVYATPQAVLIDGKGKLYYRGNYNRSRYCTDARSNFAQMAIDSLLAGKPAPVFMELATRAYGCQLTD